MAAGKTDSEGRFVLHTYRNGDGAFMGTCKVTVAPFAVGVDDPPDSEPSHNKLSNDRSDIPGIYQSPATSPLSAGVVAGQRNHFEFELAR